MNHESSRSPRLLFTAVLQIFGLAGFAIAQPLLDLLARHADFLVVHRTSPGEIWTLSLLLLLLVPTVLSLPVALVWWRGHRAFRLVHTAIVAALLTALVLAPLNRTTSISDLGKVAIALSVGLAVAMLQHRVTLVRRYLTFSFVALPVFLVTFAAREPIREQLFPDDAPVVEGPTTTTDASIVMVILDALPLSSLLNENLEIDGGRYPNFAALSRESIWLRNASTVSDRTLFSIPSILSGKNSRSGQRATLQHHPETLFTLLRNTHDYLVYEPLTFLCPEDLSMQRPMSSGARIRSIMADLRVLYLHVVVPESYRGGVPDIAQKWKDFAQAPEENERLAEVDKVRAFEDYLGNIHPTDRPAFYFLHTMFPHGPFRHLPSGKFFSRTGREPSGQGDLSHHRDSDTMAAEHSYQRHLLQLEYTDQLLGRLIDRLKDTGNYDKSMIVLLSDHGESFRANDYNRHLSQTNYSDIMPIPLFMKMPDQSEGFAVDNVADTIDIVPTMADLLQFEIPWETDGRSVFGDDDPESPIRECWGMKARVRVEDETLQTQLQAAVDRKVYLFGSGEERSTMFGLGRFADLVGRPVDEFNLEVDSDTAVGIEDIERFDDIDLSSDFIPVELVGFVHRSQRSSSSASLAIAVNGTIVATTQTYRGAPGASGLSWSALIPESSLRDGANEIVALGVTGTAVEPTLVRLDQKGRQLDFTGVKLGQMRLLGVEETGFHSSRPYRGQPVRWSYGEVSLKVPIAAERNPKTLRMWLGGAFGESSEIRIFANGTELFQGPMPKAAWRRDLSLENIPMDGMLEVSWMVDTAPESPAVEGMPPPHEFGVAVEGIWVLESSGAGEYQTTERLEPRNDRETNQDRIRRAQAHSSDGEHGIAVALLDSVLILEPGRADVFFVRGMVKEKMGDPAGSMADMLRALESNARYAPALEKVVEVHLKQEKIAEAIPYLKTLVAAKPNDPNIRYNLGVAAHRVGDAATARHQLEEFLAKSPEDPRAGAVQTILDGIEE